jgi:hypothetical protein
MSRAIGSITLYLYPLVCQEKIYWFNPATFLCLSQTRTWISIIIYRGLFVFSELRLEEIVLIGEIVDITV